jgi:excisionase family DNA binding protein
LAATSEAGVEVSIEQHSDEQGNGVTEKVPNRRLAYRPAELAAMVGLSTKAIYRAVERGELEAAKVANGTRLLIPAEAAEAWLARNAVVPTARVEPADGARTRRAGRPLGDALARLGKVVGGE